jgi:hypothetical protein
VVGEIQKAYHAYAGILKREADEAYEAVERLRSGPIAMPRDGEWQSFVYKNEQFVDPRIPVRRAENIYYPGKDSPGAAEVRAGMLERKSKYLKSYTPGWSVVLCCALCYDTYDLHPGTSYHRHTYTNSNRRIASALNNRSCLCIYRTKSSAHAQA